MPFPPRSPAFTLIELLVVVAIIAVLTAVALPNFLEAQVRARVSRVRADLRSLATGLESYRVDHDEYPDGTDNPSRYDPAIVAFLGALAPGYYTLGTTGGGLVAGRDFATLTTPVAYISTMPVDLFAQQVGGNLAYSYRNAKERRNGYVLTSFGPDGDVLNPGGVGSSNHGNPLSTARDTNSPARMGDVNERAVIHYLEDTHAALVAEVDAFGGLGAALADLTDDPTNGTVSEGDLIRLGP